MPQPNRPPTDIALSPDSIAEHSANGAVVGGLSTVDPDVGDTFSYELLDNAGGRFALSGSQIVVADGTLLDYAAAASYTILVRSTDEGGLSVEKDLTISLTVDRLPPVATVSLNAHATATNGSLVATATKVDPDGDPVSLTFVWQVNGVTERTFTSATAVSDTFDLGAAGNCAIGDVITVAVIPDDGAISGVTVTDTATVVHALPGDANGDGVVNGADLNIVLSNYDKTGMDWAQGDFNGDGIVNGADLNIVLSNYGQSLAVSAAVVTPPTAPIDQAPSQAAPTNASPIHVTAVVSEPARDFTAADVTPGGTAPGEQVTAVSGRGATYDVEVGGMTGGGTVVATIAAGTAHDAAGNPNATSTSTDNTVLYSPPPSVALARPISKTSAVGRTQSMVVASPVPLPVNASTAPNLLSPHTSVAPHGSPAAKRVDLLTAVMREMGQMLAYQEAAKNLQNSFSTDAENLDPLFASSNDDGSEKWLWL